MAAASVPVPHELPMVFEENLGQAADNVQFLARSKGYTVFFTPTEAVLILRSNGDDEAGDNSVSLLRMRPIGKRKTPRLVGEALLPGKVNYFVGEQANWKKGLRLYGQLRYEGIYPGIDLVFYGNRGHLEYDFIVAPGADPDLVSIEFDGALSTSIGPAGDLLLGTSTGVLTMRRPVAWQGKGADRRRVPAGFYLERGGKVGFALGDWDRSRELSIDPILDYSSFLGGGSGDEAYDVAIGPTGDLYVAGKTLSTDFPQVSACADCVANSTIPLAHDAFVARIDPSLTGAASLVYASYLGGGDTDWGLGIAVDSSGSAFVTGKTDSSNFPTASQVGNPFQDNSHGSQGFEAFVTKLSPDGSAIVYSTLLGRASTQGSAVAVDSSSRAWVVGSTTSSEFFPVNGAVQGSLNGEGDAFLTVFNADGTDVVASTFLGGAGFEEGLGVALDSLGAAWVVGRTTSVDFPVTQDAWRSAKSPAGLGINNGFASRIELVGGATLQLDRSTYIPGGTIIANGVAPLASGAVYVTGTVDFPGGFTVTGGVQQAYGGGGDGFLLKLAPTAGSLEWGSYIGGNGVDGAFAVAADAAGNATVVGTPNSSDFPVERAFQPSYGGGGSDAFVSRFHSSGSALVYSTFLGGSNDDQGKGVTLDGNARAYLAGISSSSDFSVSGSAAQSTNAGLSDAFVAVISDSGCQDATECDDGNPCTDDACDPATGGCLHTPAPGLACQVDDICGLVDDPCGIDTAVTVIPGTALNFGGREVQVTTGGSLHFPAGTSTVICGALTVNTPAAAAFTAETTTALATVNVLASSVSFNGGIDGSGERPAKFSFTAPGNIGLSGSVNLDGTGPLSSGGDLALNSTGASVTLASTVNASSGAEGAGGVVTVQAAFHAEISGDIVATGHNDTGGDLAVTAGGSVDLFGDVNVNSTG